MITFIFNVGQQGKNGDVSRQLAALVELKVQIETAAALARCPFHKLNSRATVLLSGFRYGCKWEIMDSCCPEYTASIESAMLVGEEDPEPNSG